MSKKHLIKFLFRFCLSIIFIKPCISFSQNFIVKDEDAKLAESYKKLYPDETTVCLNSKEEYDFLINSDDSKKVSSLINISDEFIALKDNISFDKADFYNDEIEIIHPRAFDKNGRPISIQTLYKDYESNGIFFSDEKVCYFSIPVKTRGEKFSYGYKKKIKDVKYLTGVFFASSYPITQKIVSFKIPKWLTVEIKEFNFEGFNITKDSSIDGNLKTIIYTIKDLPALKNEKNSPEIAKYSPHVIVLCKNYMKDNVKHKLIETVDDLYSWYYSLVSSVNNDRDTLKPIVQKLIADKKTDIEKTESIFYWIQENIRYIAFENGIMGFKPQAAQIVYNKRYGDCKGMANLTKEMLCAAGYDARLTWLGTNDLPYDYSTPSLAVDNHMICTLFLNDKRYFLDATEGYISFNDYANRIQNRQVLIQDGLKYIIDTIPQFSKERNKIEKRSICILNNDKITGSVVKIFNGEEKTNILRSYATIETDKKEESLKNFLSNNNKNILISTVEPTDFKEREKPLEIKYNFELSNQLTESGKEIYINIETDKDFSKYEFDSTRVNDYEFYCKKYFVSTTEFTIPSGYKTDYIPSAVNLKYDDFSFNLEYTQQGNKIFYKKEISIDNAIVKKSEFKTWNKCIKEINKFYNDQIVLIKQ